MDERKQFGLAWNVLDQRRRSEVRRLALSGRRAPDPQTAWLVAMFVGPIGPLVSIVLLSFGVFGWIGSGVVALIAVVRNGMSSPWLPVWPIVEVLIGVLMLRLFLNLRRARRLNAAYAIAPDRDEGLLDKPRT